MDCLENAGRLTAADYVWATLYSTLSPCDMCSGAALLYGVLKAVVVDGARCVEMMERFVREKPELWGGGC